MQFVYDSSMSTSPTQHLTLTSSPLLGTAQRPRSRQAHTLLMTATGIRANSSVAILYMRRLQRILGENPRSVSPKSEKAQSSPMRPKPSRKKDPSKGGPTSKGRIAVDRAGRFKQNSKQGFREKLSKPRLMQHYKLKQRGGVSKTREYAPGKSTTGKPQQAQRQRNEKKAQQKSLIKKIIVRSVKVDASYARLTMTEIDERSKQSGKILARLTEQLKLLTGLKGSRLEGLQRWRELNKNKRLARASASAQGSTQPLVRAVKSQTRPLPSESSKLDFNGLLPRLASAVRESRQRIAVLRAQLPSYLSPAHTPAVPPAARLAPTGSEAAIPQATTPQPLNSMSTISLRANRITKRLALLAAQTSAILPNTPVLLRKHSARIKPRSRLSRQPDKIVGPSRPELEGSSPQLLERQIQRRTAPLLRLQSRRARLVGRRYRLTPRRVRIRRLESLGRMWRRTMVSRPRIRKRSVTRRKDKGGLVDEVEGWLGVVTGGGAG